MPLYRRVHLANCGMFSNVTSYLIHCWLVEQKDEIVVPIWTDSPYSIDFRRSDAWDQYFLRHGHTKGHRRTPHSFPRRYSACFIVPRTDYMPAPKPRRRYARYVDPFIVMLPCAEREEGHRILQKYLHMRPEIQTQVETAAARVRAQGPHIVGLHMRGPGRIDGGMPQLCEMMKTQWPPYDEHFSLLESRLRKDSRIFLATDDSDVRVRVLDRYGDRVITNTEVWLTAGGEPHHVAEYMKGPASGRLRFQTGLDVLKDAYSLAACDEMVYGLSNVDNFVSIANPKMPIFSIFDELYAKMAACDIEEALK